MTCRERPIIKENWKNIEVVTYLMSKTLASPHQHAGEMSTIEYR